ncbi:hypothetical protein [Methanothrix harundinacea]|uniref:4Fe-4S ferredoxin iron-sulfur binding domain protein n=1 Tax=Methanothrix harundinacea (strain 6Ac) TaxID=1110509 RepID=G7WLD9_METH6|nr:hypothetical protein [Methanothrix harundinacea]AET64242.1 4Fe-4S ferredoxin iron-sulfur binding domain protein [Methanothrix harundinacea 6Ac]
MVRWRGRGSKRTILFPRALDDFESENVKSLAEVCPNKAISVTLADDIPRVESFTLTFEMVPYCRCRIPFATEKDMAYIGELLPDAVPARSSDPSWMNLCPTCRR